MSEELPEALAGLEERPLEEHPPALERAADDLRALLEGREAPGREPG